MKLVIQIPCFNEATTLPAVIAELPKRVAGVDEISVLVIDDGSTDRTVEVATELGLHVVRNRGNKGLARTFVFGLEAALAMGADIIVNTDGDNQYPGEAIERLVAPILAGEADLVIGDRQTASDPNVSGRKQFFYDLGNFVVRTTTGLSVHDAPSGFRAMSREFAMGVYLTNPFSYTLETIYAAAEQRYALKEVPIVANKATRKSRLFRGLGEYIRRSASIIIQGYSMHNPLRAFAAISMPFIVLGIVLGIRFLYFYFSEPDRSGHVQSLILAAISTVVGAQIFLFGMLGSLIRANRLLLQDIRMRVRRLELGEPAAGSDQQGRRGKAGAQVAGETSAEARDRARLG
ncbi:MAG: glycosyltransferase family 2 protein [Myxococcales bacterium]|nr:glycosyltransferase family 2 protein [Myxococcales bacterium]MDD9971308.1 glycosyltransferase family 2 protein [Myxococcales bacterium]